MKTVELTIYKFEELNDKAKDRARQWCRENADFGWADESIDSIKTFCNHYGVRLTNWSIGAHSPYSYDIDYPPSTFRGIKLKDVDRNAMPTGCATMSSCRWKWRSPTSSPGCTIAAI